MIFEGGLGEISKNIIFYRSILLSNVFLLENGNFFGEVLVSKMIDSRF